MIPCKRSPNQNKKEKKSAERRTKVLRDGRTGRERDKPHNKNHYTEPGRKDSKEQKGQETLPTGVYLQE